METQTLTSPDGHRFELRGQGTSSLRAGRDCNWGYEDAIRNDWPAMVAAVRERSGGRPLYLFGHSLGRQARQEMLDWAGSARHGHYRPAGAEIDYEAALAAAH